MKFTDTSVPTELFLSQNCMQNFYQSCSKFGKNVLIVTGRTSALRSGALQQVCDALRSNDVNFEIFDEITPNPLIFQVQKCANQYQQNSFDSIIAVGGGSVIDAAKAICFQLQGVDCMTPQQISPLPLIAVPTAVGTGSEINQYSILTIPSKQTKMSIPNKCYPSQTFVNPQFLETVPLDQIRSMYFDIVCHAVESSLTVKSTEIQRKYAKQALQSLSEVKILLDGELNPEALEKFAWASVYAGISIGISGTSIPHGFSYPITYFKGVSHGAACAMFLCNYLEICEQKTVLELLQDLGVASLEHMRLFVEKYIQKVKLTEEEKNQYMAGVKKSGKLNQHPAQINDDQLYKIM